MTQRVAIFVPSLAGGGAERSALFVAKAIAQAGYALDLVVADARGALRSDSFVQDHLVDLQAPLELLSLRAYVRYLRRRRPNLVISFVHVANLVSALGAMIVPEVPFVVSVRNTLAKPRHDQWWVRRWLGFGLERRLYRRARYVQVISQELARECRARFATPPEQLWITHSTAGALGDDQTVPAPNVSSGTPGEITEHQPFLVSAGRLVPIKGFATLIDAFARARIDPAYRLLIIGEGPERPRLERQIARLGLSDRVRLIGYRDPLLPWIAASRGFLFATRGEGVPRVVMEALAAGVPVAACRATGGIIELLGDGAYGRLLPLDDAEAFARAMEDMAAGSLAPAEPDALAHHLRRYAPEAVAREYLAMVHSCIGAPA